MHDHYEYKVFRKDPQLGSEVEFFGQFCLPTAEACRRDFLRRFPDNLELRCTIRNSCGYKGVMEKSAGKKYFRHFPDTGWHVNQ